MAHSRRENPLPVLAAFRCGGDLQIAPIRACAAKVGSVPLIVSSPPLRFRGAAKVWSRAPLRSGPDRWRMAGKGRFYKRPIKAFSTNIS